MKTTTTTTTMSSVRNTSHRSCFLLHLLIGAIAILSSSVVEVVEGVIPTVEILLRTNGDDVSTTSLLVSEAYYGPQPPVQNTSKSTSGDGDVGDQKRLVSPPKSNPFLCLDAGDVAIDQEILKSTKGAWMVIPRGGCTYEHKTWIAQSIYESSGVIVYNTLDSRYSFTGNKTDDGVNIISWPQEHDDYDCDNAEAEIPSNELLFFSNPDEAKSSGAGGGTGPYDFETNDRLLSGDTVDNLCKIHDPKGLRNCPSKRCLVAHDTATSAAAASADTTTVCCAWDIRLNPYPDDDLVKNNVTITITTLFATMEQWGILSEAMDKSSSLTVSVHTRWRPTFNSSAVLIVLLGVFVAAFGSFRSASDYHVAISKLWQTKKKGESSRLNPNLNSASGNQQQQQQPNEESLVPRNNFLAEESLELEPMHALAFLVMASISLFVLFFFKVRTIDSVLYYTKVKITFKRKSFVVSCRVVSCLECNQSINTINQLVCGTEYIVPLPYYNVMPS